MTKQQRLWQKRRKNTAIKKRFRLVRNHANPWERRGALPRLPGASIPSPCQKESPTILSQPACWCSQTRSSLCFNGKRRKSSKNGNSQNTEAMLIFWLKSALEKTHHYSKQNREVLATPSLSSLPGRVSASNVLAMSTLKVSLLLTSLTAC